MDGETMGLAGATERETERAGNGRIVSTRVDSYHEKFDRASRARLCDVAMPELNWIVRGLGGFMGALNSFQV